MGSFNREGFSQIEALIVTAMVAVSTLAITAIFHNSLKGLGLSEVRSKETETMQALRLNLSTQSTCDKNFKSKTFQSDGSLNVTAIDDFSDSRIMQVGDLLANNKLRVTAMNLSVPKATWDSFQVKKATLPPEGYLVNSVLSVSFNRTSKVLGADTSQLTVIIPTMVDAAGTILGCYTMESSLDTLALQTSCTQLGGEFDLVKGTCVFTQDCSALESYKPVDGKCVLEKINLVQKQIDVFEDQLTELTTPKVTTRSLVENCVKNAKNLRISGDSVHCTIGSGSVSVYEITPTMFKSSRLMNHVDIRTAKEAKIMYDFTRGILEGTVQTVLDGNQGSEE